MIPAQYFRNHLNQIEAMLKKRGMEIDLSSFKELEEQRKSLQVETEGLQAKSNQLSKEVALGKQSGQDMSGLFKELGILAKDKKNKEAALKSVQDEIQNTIAAIPNLLSEQVPEGLSEVDNVIVETYGEIPSFDFQVRSHIDLFPRSLDFACAAQISGSRYVMMKGKIAKLHRALGQWMLDVHTEAGYQEVNPPLLVEPKALFGTGQLPKFKEDQFFTQSESHALIPTAEVPLTNIYRDQIVAQDKLPIKLTALTPCFRSEAGSYGKDTAGLMRLHQFEKVELVQLVDAQNAHQALDALVNDAASILTLLKLPFRKVLLCAGDTGFSSHITYDLEVWVPSENRYREISSCSYFADFQARRMKARYRDDQKKVNYLHTLNGSGLAVGRTLLAVIENYQTKEGTIIVPEVLKPYMNGLEVISDE